MLKGKKWPQGTGIFFVDVVIEDGVTGPFSATYEEVREAVRAGCDVVIRTHKFSSGERILTHLGNLSYINSTQAFFSMRNQNLGPGSASSYSLYPTTTETVEE